MVIDLLYYVTEQRHSTLRIRRRIPSPRVPHLYFTFSLSFCSNFTERERRNAETESSSSSSPLLRRRLRSPPARVGLPPPVVLLLLVRPRCLRFNKDALWECRRAFPLLPRGGFLLLLDDGPVLKNVIIIIVIIIEEKRRRGGAF